MYFARPTLYYILINYFSINNIWHASVGATILDNLSRCDPILFPSEINNDVGYPFKKGQNICP